jgi:hypothetical protein
MGGRDLLSRRSEGVGDGEPACKPDCETSGRADGSERPFPALTRNRAPGGARCLAQIRLPARHVRVTMTTQLGPGEDGARGAARRPAFAPGLGRAP